MNHKANEDVHSIDSSLLQSNCGSSDYNAQNEISQPESDMVEVFGDRVVSQTRSYRRSRLKGNLASFDEMEDVVKAKRSRSSQQLVLRGYQQELANAALQGHNVLICAPTGSGKSCVAVQIAIERFQAVTKQRDAEEARRPAKIAFLVTTQNLVEQRKAQFELFSSLRVIGITGGELNGVNRMPLRYEMDRYDVFVMTGAILLNSIRIQEASKFCPGPDQVDNADKLESINIFSLLIFDECHHCYKDHVYNCIMREHYLPLKHAAVAVGSVPIELPQIVGLSLSPCTSVVTDTKQAVEHLIGMCARLDVDRFCTVRHETGELGNTVGSSAYEVLRCKTRFPDKFAELLLDLTKQLCSIIESLTDHNSNAILHALNGSSLQFRKLRPPNVTGKSIGTRCWASYIGTAETLLGQLNSSLDTTRHDLLFCINLLKLYNTAVRLNKTARHKDALNYVRSVFNCSAYLLAGNDVSDTSDGFEQALANTLSETSPTSFSHADSPSSDAEVSIKRTAISNFRKLESQLEQLANAEMQQLKDVQTTGVNEKLRVLKREITAQFDREVNSRVLVVVCERLHGIALHDFCCTDELLSRLNVGRLASTNITQRRGGLSQRQQDELLRLFSHGHRVVVSTGVASAEESVDIARCNLVIRYCYASSEIGLARARASESRCVLIVDECDELAQKEAANEKCSKLRREAIAQISQLDESVFKQRVQRLQFREYLLWQQRQKKQKATKQKQKQKQTAVTITTESETYNLLCKSCSTLITTSDKLAKILEVHAVLHAPVFDRVYVVPNAVAKATGCFVNKFVCGNHACLMPIGQLFRYRKMNFCVLTVGAVCLEHGLTGKRSVHRRWKQSPVEVERATMERLYNYSSSITDQVIRTLPLELRSNCHFQDADRSE